MAKRSHHSSSLWSQLLQDSRELVYQVWTKILKKSTDPVRCQKGQHPYEYQRYPYSSSPQPKTSLPMPLTSPPPQQQPFLQQHSSDHGVESTFYLPVHALPTQKSSFSSASSSYTSLATLSEYQSLWEVQLVLQEIPDMMDENLLTTMEDFSRFRAGPCQALESSWSKDDGAFLRSIPPQDQPPFLPLPLVTESPEHEVHPGNEDDQGDDKDEGDEGEEELTRGEDQFPLCYLENEFLDELHLAGSREPSRILFYPSLSLDSLPIEPKNSPLGLDDKNSLALDVHLQPQKLLTKDETLQEMFFTPGTFLRASAVTAATAASASSHGDAYAGDSIAYESLDVGIVIDEEENEEETTEGRGGEEGVLKWDGQCRKKGMPATATATTTTNPLSGMTKVQEEDQQVSKCADRHDRKDSGFFMHDEEEGVFVQVSPRPKGRRRAQRRASATKTMDRAMNIHSESDSSDWFSGEEEKEVHGGGLDAMHPRHMYIY